MSEHEARKVARVGKWVSLAERDLRLARHLRDQPALEPYAQAAFLAQQCVEKYLKAWLDLHEVEFPYSHNIARLRTLCEINGAKWAIGLDEADTLSAYAVNIRYPGEQEDIQAEEASLAVRIALKSLNDIRKILSAELSSMYAASQETDIILEYRKLKLEDRD
jgi:HEPN domain-containing protein